MEVAEIISEIISHILFINGGLFVLTLCVDNLLNFAIEKKFPKLLSRWYTITVMSLCIWLTSILIILTTR